MNDLESTITINKMIPEENERNSAICVLHMLIPQEARKRAKLAAVASGMSFRGYMTQLLMSAEPLEIPGIAIHNPRP